MSTDTAIRPGAALPDDLVEAILGIDPASALGQLRRERPEILRHGEGAFRALVLPAVPGGVSSAERAALALRVALAEGHAALAERFRAFLAGHPEEQEAATRPQPEGRGRLATLLRYADLVARHPGDVGQQQVNALSALGLSAQDIVAVTQLVSFVPYQTRLLAGLRLLRDEGDPPSSGATASAGASASEPSVRNTSLPDTPALDQPAEDAPAASAPTIHARRFTMAEVGWEPRLPPVLAETATADQLAALEACPPAQRRSTYFLTLANDPSSLSERGALFNSVMYAPRGLPRAERELATAAVSIVNGCIYCASVHARRFSELTKEAPAMQRLLDEGLDTPLDARRRAIVDFSAAMTRDPEAMDPVALRPLRVAGLTELEILDLVHAVAMFANANRLMQSLGRSVVPEETTPPG